jgi:hypothetical protein
MTMKKAILISVVLLGIIFTSCQKDFDEQPIQAPTTMDDLQVPSNFDWKTTKDINFNLKGDYNSIVEVLASNGKVYHKAFLTQNHTYGVKLTLPSYEKQITLRYKGQEVPIELDGSTVNHTF